MQAPPQRNVAGDRSWRVIAVIVDYDFIIDLEHCPVVRIHDELVEIIRIDFHESVELHRVVDGATELSQVERVGNPRGHLRAARCPERCEFPVEQRERELGLRISVFRREIGTAQKRRVVDDATPALRCNDDESE